MFSVRLWKLRVERVCRILTILAIVCITILRPGSVLAQTCSDQDLTTTPAPPTNPRSHELSLKQLHLALII
jgi:hypothetical protein